MEEIYDTRNVENKLGRVIIYRSFVTLAGQEDATKLVFGQQQKTNVIRIIGSGVGHVTAHDLLADGNRAENDQGTGDPNISRDAFEFCGINAYLREPRAQVSADDQATHDVTVRGCTVIIHCQRLGIMLDKPNMRIADKFLDNAGSDSLEILRSPGQIRGNHGDIAGRTHVAIESDAGSSIIMANHVLRGSRRAARDPAESARGSAAR